MENLEFRSVGPEHINSIRELWEGLRSHHVEKTKYFRENFQSISFDKRAADILNNGKGGAVNIDLVVEKVSNNAVGYCVSSISQSKEGEVESIFILPEFRGEGAGDKLMERAVSWLEANGAEKIKLGVVYGNDEVLNFYERHGFYPRTYVLYKK